MAATKEVYGSWAVLTGTEGEVAQALSDEGVLVHHTIGITSPTSDKVSVLYRKG